MIVLFYLLLGQHIVVPVLSEAFQLLFVGFGLIFDVRVRVFHLCKFLFDVFGLFVDFLVTVRQLEVCEEVQILNALIDFLQTFIDLYEFEVVLNQVHFVEKILDFLLQRRQIVVF